MQAQITSITRRARGDLRKSSVVTGGYLRIGRNAHSEILLSDLRMAMEEAELHIENGELRLIRKGTNPLTVNGQGTNTGLLKVGDELRLGPYRLVIEEPPEGVDAAIGVELVTPLSEDVERLTSTSRIGLANTWFSRRGFAWSLALVIALLFLAFPLAGHFMSRASQDGSGSAPAVLAAFHKTWSAGEVSNPHKFFSSNCANCHEQSFKTVQDEACASCHNTVNHHFDPATVTPAAAGQLSCTNCHKEHRGPVMASGATQGVCLDCHADIKKVAPNTKLANAGDFSSGHPPFHPIVSLDGKTLARVDSMDAKQQSNLKFPHSTHLAQGGVRGQTGMVKLECSNCHVPERDGALMKPVAFEQSCANCHSLAFTAEGGGRAVPHGNPDLAKRTVEEFFSKVALDGGSVDTTAPETIRRRPGVPLTDPQRLEAAQWAKVKAAEAMEIVFDDKRGCGSCHTVQKTDAGYGIVPVKISWVSMPEAHFNHAKHAAVTCTNCHNAPASTSSADILLPQIATCQNCHGGVGETTKVASSCMTCHDLHRKELGPMRPLPAGKTSRMPQPVAIRSGTN